MQNYCKKVSFFLSTKKVFRTNKIVQINIYTFPASPNNQ